jgi:hypothetical protein
LTPTTARCSTTEIASKLAAAMMPRRHQRRADLGTS